MASEVTDISGTPGFMSSNMNNLIQLMAAGGAGLLQGSSLEGFGKGVGDLVAGSAANRNKAQILAQLLGGQPDTVPTPTEPSTLESPAALPGSRSVEDIIMSLGGDPETGDISTLTTDGTNRTLTLKGPAGGTATANPFSQGRAPSGADFGSIDPRLLMGLSGQDMLTIQGMVESQKRFDFEKQQATEATEADKQDRLLRTMSFIKGMTPEWMRSFNVWKQMPESANKQQIGIQQGFLSEESQTTENFNASVKAWQASGIPANLIPDIGTFIKNPEYIDYVNEFQSELSIDSGLKVGAGEGDFPTFHKWNETRRKLRSPGAAAIDAFDKAVATAEGGAAGKALEDATQTYISTNLRNVDWLTENGQFDMADALDDLKFKETLVATARKKGGIVAKEKAQSEHLDAFTKFTQMERLLIINKLAGAINIGADQIQFHDLEKGEWGFYVPFDENNSLLNSPKFKDKKRTYKGETYVKLSSYSTQF